MTQSIGPTWANLLWSTLPVLVVLALLSWRRLGQVTPLAVSMLRLVAQLGLLSMALGWIFAAQSPWIVGAVTLAMLLVSAHTVGSRQVGRRWEVRVEAFISIGLATIIVMVVALRLALRLTPWYDARTVIPLVGMVLGNSLTGVSLAAERLEGELRAERDRVELRLALGATSRQAALPALRAAVRAALTPIINNMAIAGIVSIPGMMTGQLLAGADVNDALRYQILIYLAISGTVGLGTLGLLALRLRRYFTPAYQLRADRLGTPGG
ncbi:MAG: ABC transporter permease [Isosphaeraceae bacterium]